MTDQYSDFLRTKRFAAPSVGRPCDPEEVNPRLFEFQKRLVAFCVKKGRSALLTGTGTGKSLMQIEVARLIGKRTLIICPLAVAQQTIRIGETLGVPITYARSQEEASPAGITICNYEMVDHLDTDAFEMVVLDESSCLKDNTAKRHSQFIKAFQRTPYRLGASASPAPNSPVEIGSQSEFLGLLRYEEMLSRYFLHEAGPHWRLKRPAVDSFYKWMASWSVTMNRPDELGFQQAGFDLPPLHIHPIFVPTNYAPVGKLFADKLAGITERAAVRKDTVRERTRAAVNIIESEPDERWLIWTGFQVEADAIRTALRIRYGAGCQEVKGSDSIDHKERTLLAFADGKLPCLVSKASIAGWGLNLQCCARMLFLGLSDSFESYFQAVRRVWRFGQLRSVHVYIVLSEPERVVYENVMRKERQAMEMSKELIKHVRDYERAELGTAEQRDEYDPRQEMLLPAWLCGESG